MLFKNNLIFYFVASLNFWILPDVIYYSGLTYIVKYFHSCDFWCYGAWHVLVNFSRIVLTYIASFPVNSPNSFFKKEVHQIMNGITRKNISAEIKGFKRRTILHQHNPHANPHANASRMLFLFCWILQLIPW